MFILRKRPLSWWQRPQGVSPVFVVLQLPRASPHRCDGFWCTWATLIARDIISCMLKLNDKGEGGPSPENFLFLWVCPHVLAPQVAAPQPGRDVGTGAFWHAQQRFLPGWVMFLKRAGIYY